MNVSTLLLSREPLLRFSAPWSSKTNGSIGDNFAILGIPAALLAGGATFLFSWLPLLGSFPIWIAGVACLFALKGRSQMHPLVSLVSIFGGIKMFGPFGVILGPTLTGIPHDNQRAVLSWGILEALLFRLIFIFAGIAVIGR